VTGFVSPDFAGKKFPLSFYGGCAWRDTLIPIPEHWNAWEMTASLRAISDRRPQAVFRGTLTGKYLDERNIRLALCKRFVKHPNFNVGLNAWTNRERIIAEGDGQRVLLPTAPNATLLKPGMTQEEQASYQILLYAHGHVASSRLAWQLCSGSVVVYIESECDAPDMWFTGMIPFVQDLTSIGDGCYVRTSLDHLENVVDTLLKNPSLCTRLTRNALEKCAQVFCRNNQKLVLKQAIEKSQEKQSFEF
jgi:hypothetical protein